MFPLSFPDSSFRYLYRLSRCVLTPQYIPLSPPSGQNPFLVRASAAGGLWAPLVFGLGLLRPPVFPAQPLGNFGRLTFPIQPRQSPPVFSFRVSAHLFLLPSLFLIFFRCRNRYFLLYLFAVWHAFEYIWYLSLRGTSPPTRLSFRAAPASF